MQLTLLEYTTYPATASQIPDADISKLKSKRSVFGQQFLDFCPQCA